MKFLVAVWYEFQKSVRDVKMMVIMIVFPIVVIYLLGTAVEGFFNKDIAPKIKIAVVNEDSGPIGNAFDKFLLGDAIRDKLVVSKLTSEVEARRAVDNKEYTAMVFLPTGLSDGVLSQTKRDITIYGNDDIAFVQTIVGSFINAFNAQNAAMQQGLEPLQITGGNSVQRVNRVKSDAVPNLKDYYAILVLLQVLIVGGVFGANITSKEYGSDMHIRVHALPVSQWSLLAGRILGSTFCLCLTSLAVIAFTGFAYGVNWNGSVPVMAWTILFFSFLMVGMGAVFGKLFQRFSAALMAILVLLFFFGIASGSVSPTSGVTALGFLTPNYYGKILLFGSIYGYSASLMIRSALCLLGFAALTFIALILLSRRVRNDSL